MPSGIVHARCSLMLAAPAFGLGFGATGDYLNGLTCALGCCLGILLTPDLDQESISSSEYALIKWTMGLGFLWTMLWYPYARLCKHRSPLSHLPLLGTAGRLLYLGLFVFLLTYLGVKLPQLPLPLLGWSIAGLVLSDTLHWLMDISGGEHRSNRRHSRH